MKKITLLLVAAVFAIGIQSCSTEEEVFDQEFKTSSSQNTGKKMSLNLLDSNTEPQCRIFVRYAPSMNGIDRYDFFLWAKENVFTQILARVDDDGCEFIDEWYVPCSEIPSFGKGRTGGTNVMDGKKKEADVDDPPGDIFEKIFRYYEIEYLNCGEVPPYDEDF